MGVVVVVIDGVVGVVRGVEGVEGVVSVVRGVDGVVSVVRGVDGVVSVVVVADGVVGGVQLLGGVDVRRRCRIFQLDGIRFVSCYCYSAYLNIYIVGCIYFTTDTPTPYPLPWMRPRGHTR